MDPSSPMTNSVDSQIRRGASAEDGEQRFYPPYPGYAPGYPPPPHMGQYGSMGGGPGPGYPPSQHPYGGMPYGPGPYGAPFPAPGRGPPMGYGYEPGFYPGQPMKPGHPSQRSTRGGHSTVGPGLKKDKAEARSDEGPSTAYVDELEAERLKASADAELTLSEVKPIQTDFHFFVMEVRDKLRLEAEKEVKATAGAKARDPYLINTNLNARLMKAWEDLDPSEREAYGRKEEADRRRFMEEDEVASRHCATLTARVKSPAEPSSPNRKKKGTKDDREKWDDDRNALDDREKWDEEETGTPEIKKEDSREEDLEDVAEELEEPDSKRSPSKLDEDDESPSKKNRVDDADA